MRVDRNFMFWVRRSIPPEERRKEAVQSLFDMAHHWDERVVEVTEHLRRHRASKYSIGGRRIGDAPGGRRGYVDRGLDNIIGTEEYLEEKLKEVRKDRDKALKMVNESLATIKTPKAREALRMICLDGKTAPEAGKVLGVTDRQIRRLKVIGYREMRLPESWEKKLVA